MKNLNLLTLALLLSLSFSSCISDNGLMCTKANGELVTEDRDLDKFTSIDLQMSADVIIEQGDEYRAEVKASDNIVDMILTKVSGNELNIRLPRGECIRGNSDIVVTVTAPYIDEIKVSGSGDISNKDGWKTDDLKLDVTGSGEIILTDLEVDNYDIDITGSGAIELTGDDAETGKIQISGSGDADIMDLQVEDCEIDITGSGSAKVAVEETLDVRISGSGDVIYSGDPSIEKRVTGSGDIRKR